MLCSQERKKREFAVAMILSIRGEMEMGDKSVRLHKLPYFNLKATSLEMLTCWDEASEPITTCHLTRKKLEQFKGEKMKPREGSPEDDDALTRHSSTRDRSQASLEERIAD